MIEKILSHKIMITFCIILAGVGGVTYWYIKNKNAKAKGYLKTEKPAMRDLSQYISASGTLRAKDPLTIGSIEAGRVIQILVDYNDPVKKDQVLAILDNGIGDTEVKRFKADLQQAQSQLTYQKKYYERQRELYKSKQLSQNQFDAITQDYEVAQAHVLSQQAQLEESERKYGNLFIKAPTDGVIISRQVDLGQMITSVLSATVLFQMAKDLTQLEAFVDIDEADVGLVKDNDEAFFTVDALPTKIFKTKVRLTQYLSKVTDNVVTYASILTVANPDKILRPGMTTNVEINVSANSNALSIVNKALRINSKKLEEYAKINNLNFEPISQTKQSEKFKTQNFLWILDGKTIKQVAVTLGTMDTQYVEIISGITQDTHVITEFFMTQEDQSFLNRFVPQSSIGR